MYIVSFLSSYIKFSTKQLYYFALDPTEYNSQQLREHPSLWKGATRRREILWLSSIGVSWWAASQNYLLCIDWGMTFLGTTLWRTGRNQSPPPTVPSSPPYTLFWGHWHYWHISVAFVAASDKRDEAERLLVGQGKQKTVLLGYCCREGIRPFRLVELEAGDN